MKDKTYILDMFPDYEPPETLKNAISQAAIVAADIDPVGRGVDVAVFSQSYIPRRLWESAEKDISSLYGLRFLHIHATYPAEEICKLEREELLSLFVQHNSMARGALAGAQWSWEDSTLTIQLVANGKDMLMESVSQIQRYLQEQFGAPVTIHIEAGKTLEGKALFEAMERMRADMVGDLPAASAAPKKEVAPVNEAYYGKPFKGNVTAMKDLDLDMGSVIVEGRVFAVDHKELKKRNAWVVCFDMTDNTGSVRVKRFLENKDAKTIVEKVSVGSVLRVQGKMVVDKFDNETVMNPYGILPGSMSKRKDLAEGEKRVELHLHTVMSNMDALTQTKAAIKQAAAWGHRAIAITDHGCVQSFTDALHTVEDWKGAPKVAGTDETIKVLYGCEGYYVNDVDDRLAVHGTKNITFDEEFVAFDLETTGLNAGQDRIIEIGAVVLKNGKEQERFQTFVDPERVLDRKIVDLTGITDEMLVGAPKIQEVLPEFLKFVGGRVLVAHNSKFDTGFIRSECTRLGYTYDLTDVDTLSLSQQLLPQLNKYKLDVVAKALNLPNFNHHRAADDANICGLIMTKFLPMLEEKGIFDLQSIDKVLMQQRSKGMIFARRPRHIILFAKNQMGLRNLYHLISDSNLEYFKKVPRIPKSQLMELREGLIIGSACEAGEFFQAIIEKKSDEELKRIASFYDYLEIQPLANNRFMLDKGIVSSDEELREFNRTVVRIADELDKPVVATGDVHFLNPEDEIFRHILLATKGFEDCDRDNPLYFRTTDDMLNEFSYLGTEKAYEVVVTNPNRIADMCETLRPVPHNLFAPKIENSVEDLKNLVYGKFHRLYGENPPELFVKRVETELNDIISCHYDVIYMSAQRLVQNSLEHGYLVGSRGSV